MDDIHETIKTYDKIASQYCKKTRQTKFLKWEEEYIKRMLGFISKQNPLILDAGCGDGRHCMIIDKLGAKAIGIDLSDSMLTEAKTLYPEGDFRKMDFRTLDFENGFFDGIWVSGSIYHVPKASLPGVIGEIRRVIKEKGIAAINFKIGEGEGMETNPKSFSGSPRYFAYYSKDEMQKIFDRYGFKSIKSCFYPEEIFGDRLLQMWFRKE
jgi:SAM-dependent methyltransferase